jgi:phosphoglycolate phosphatase
VDHTRLYPGVREVLEHYTGKKKAILTNKTEMFVNPILKGLGIKRQIDYAVGANGKQAPKPSGAPVEAILSRFGIRQDRAVMVGDSPVDVETGRLGGILSCAVTFGFHSKEELQRAAPDYMIDTFAALKDFFC